MSNIKIFVSHRIDKDSKLVENSIFVPVRCGAVFDRRNKVSILGDDTGDNISKRRMTFNELTVQYWAWKNVEADYYGLCHYRRYLIFSQNQLLADPYGNVLFDELDHESIMKCGLMSKKRIHDIVENNDIILSTPYDVTYRGFRNLYEHYSEVPMQHRKDLKLACQTIKHSFPEFSESVETYFDGTLFYPCNLFIMKKTIFNEYCQWLFDILFELETKIDITNYDENEQRVFGLIGERLLGVFFLYYIKKNSGCKYQILPRSLFWNTESDAREKEKLKHFLKTHLNEKDFIYRILKKTYYMFGGGK